MSTPQERIDEYLQGHDCAGGGRSPIRAAEIRKLFTQTIAELEAKNAQLKADRDKTHADAAKLLVDNLALEAACAQMREALEYCGCHEHLDHFVGGRPSCEFCNQIDKALSSDCGKEFLANVNKEFLANVKRLQEEQLWLESKESHERITNLEDQLKTAASLLRSAVYERTPLGDQWIDHFDIERQKAITEFLAGVEGKV